MPAADMAALSARRDALRTRFPQVGFSFCLVSLADGQDVREFGFWLLNRAPDADANRAWLLLVTVDHVSGRLALTPGYALEPLVDEGGWMGPLEALAAHGADGEWARGISEFLDRARALLEDAARRQPVPSPADDGAPSGAP